MSDPRITKQHVEQMLSSIKRICAKCGHNKNEDGCPHCLRTALAAAKEALRRIATHFPIDDGEEVKSLARHKCEQARDALARIAECEKGAA